MNQWGQINASKNGVTTEIALYHGQNSFGSPDVFAGLHPAAGFEEFEPLRGWPLYAIQTWLVGHGYTYEVK